MRSNNDKNQKKHPKTVLGVFQQYLGDELKWAQTQTVRSLFENDPHRSHSFFSSALGIGLDFSRERLSAHTLKQLERFAVEQSFETKRNAMFDGEIVNPSEHRSATHVWLRSAQYGQFSEPYQEMLASFVGTIAHQIQLQKWKAIVHVGVGGSDLGLRCLYDALAAQHEIKLPVSYVSSLDPIALDKALADLNPETTLVILTSKTATTLEVLDNWRRIQLWQPAHLRPTHSKIVTADAHAALSLGFCANAILPFDANIGGRFSWSSAVGVSIALAYGWDVWQQLLTGAGQMDVHFKTAPVDQNMPLRLAMISVWNNWGLDTCVSGLYPYSQALAQLPFHWQQLSMESLGKRSSHEGSPCAYRTGNVWLGGTGTQVQHTFFQMLHQGTLRFWSLFMCVRQMQGDARAIAQLQRACVSQANALALGATQEELHRYFGEAAQTNASALGNRRFVGNQSSSILTLPDVSAISLGKLMALLEHWVVSESILMDLNPFDQFGVELGKVLAKQAVGDEADLNSHMTSVFMEQMCR